MADRQNPTPRPGGERRKTDPYISGGRRQTPPRRNDVIRCENCGEDYSITYKRCPFFDERPGRGGAAGKRVANTRGGGYGRPASTLKTVTWIGSFAVVCAALFIIYRFIGAPLFSGKNLSGSFSSQSSIGSSSGGNSDLSGGDSSLPGGNTDASASGGPDVSGAAEPDPQPADSGEQGTVVNAGTGLHVRSGPGRSSPSVATLANGSQVTVLGEEDGWYQVRYSGDKTGYVSKDYVSTASAPVVVQPQPQPQPSTPVASGTRGTIINAGSGLNIRSGPGKDNSVVASASNGAEVTIVGEEDGWYRIRYSGRNEGYVAKEYVSVK